MSYQSPKPCATISPLAFVSRYATYFFIVSYCSRNTRVSPYVWYKYQGSITAADPHSGESRNPPEKVVNSGAISGTNPVTNCESRISRHILVYSVATS